MSGAPTVDRDVVEVWQGRLCTMSLSDARGELAEEVTFARGHRYRNAEDTVEAVAVTATRCAPWVRVLAGPRLWQRLPEGEDPTEWRAVHHPRDGTLWREVGGLAMVSEQPPTAYVSRHAMEPRVLGALHHELWHLVESKLAAADFEAVDRVARRGVPRPSAYLDSTLERRARLYAAWATAWEEGWRPGWPRRVDRVCRYVHSGALARDLARDGVARAQTWSAGPGAVMLPLVAVSALLCAACALALP